jgi:hypothetical protein
MASTILRAGKLSMKSQVVIFKGLRLIMVSFATTQLYHDSRKATGDNKEMSGLAVFQ